MRLAYLEPTRLSTYTSEMSVADLDLHIHETQRDAQYRGWSCTTPGCPVVLSDLALRDSFAKPEDLWKSLHIAASANALSIPARKGGLTEAMRVATKSMKDLGRAIAGRTDLEWLRDRVDEMCEAGRW